MADEKKQKMSITFCKEEPKPSEGSITFCDGEPKPSEGSITFCDEDPESEGGGNCLCCDPPELFISGVYQDVMVGDTYSASGGIGPYSFSMSGGTINPSTGEVLSISCSGNDGSDASGKVTVTDSCGTKAAMDILLDGGRWCMVYQRTYFSTTPAPCAGDVNCEPAPYRPCVSELDQYSGGLLQVVINGTKYTAGGHYLNNSNWDNPSDCENQCAKTARDACSGYATQLPWGPIQGDSYATQDYLSQCGGNCCDVTMVLCASVVTRYEWLCYPSVGCPACVDCSWGKV